MTVADIRAVGSEAGADTATELVLVAITTRQRPRMLAHCLAVCVAAERPPASSVMFLVVDNDPAESGRSAAAAAAASGARIDYIVEPQPGIPAVRNRALDAAAALRARWLAFVDDDSFPEPGWLVALVETARREKAQLTGGPILFGPPQEPIGAWRHFICRGLVASSRRRQRWRVRLSAGKAGNTVITTANWCADLPWLMAQGLRFDSRFARSGGSDTAMDRAIRGKGAKVVYEPASVVTEILPAERLTLRYQFLRRMHSGMVRSYQRRSAGRFGQALIRALIGAAASLMGAVVLFPVGMLVALANCTAGAQLVIGATRMAGRGLGFVRGMLDELPQQYRKVQGY